MTKDNPLKKVLAKALDVACAPLAPEDAALEKAEAGENRAVEHVAELAPCQTLKARSGSRRGRKAPGTPTHKKMRASVYKTPKK